MANSELACRWYGELSHEIKKGPLYQWGNKEHSTDVKFTLAVEKGSANLFFFVIFPDGKELARCKVEYRDRLS